MSEMLQIWINSGEEMTLNFNRINSQFGTGLLKYRETCYETYDIIYYSTDKKKRLIRCLSCPVIHPHKIIIDLSAKIYEVNHFRSNKKKEIFKNKKLIVIDFKKQNVINE